MKLAIPLYFAGGASGVTLIGWLLQFTPSPVLAYTLMGLILAIGWILFWFLDEPIAGATLSGDLDTYSAIMLGILAAIVLALLVLWGAVL